MVGTPRTSRTGSAVLAAALLAAPLPACATGGGQALPPPDTQGWVSLPLPDGGQLNLLVARPPGPARGVVLAFPWGAGDAGLLAGLVETYWDDAAPAAGYAVVGVEIYGPGLAESAPVVVPALLDWIEQNLPEAAGEIVLTGASAGGIGVFHAALAMPGRVAAILAMPGRYTGDASLESLAGVPILLMVGAHDGRWVTGSGSTADRLRAAGAQVELSVVPGQGHVLRVPEPMLVQWIEEQLE
ncbi:MAG: alpha/beta hydrolase-fold protein [Acidobacteriota bacterium]|nr:alpha/beta hydrolase-fold protein [Acidobacteriota bacterium]